MTVNSKELDGAIERLRNNIAAEEYQSWGQRADILTLIEAAKSYRDAMPERVVLNHEFYEAWDKLEIQPENRGMGFFELLKKRFTNGLIVEE